MALEVMAPLPDPVGPTSKTVRDGLNRILPANWNGVMESDKALRVGLRVASLGTG